MPGEPNYNRLKEIAITGVFSDDYFLERLVLKGGNAIDLIYKLAARASVDLDFSMETQFPPEEIKEIENRLKDSLESHFHEYSYQIIDWEFKSKPKDPLRHPEFWGGYVITFKVVTLANYGAFKDDFSKLRLRAESVDFTNKKSIEIEISKFEYVGRKEAHDVNEYTIFVDSPVVLVYGKLRALCQQTKGYMTMIGRSYIRPRARDFFDIYILIIELKLDIFSPENLSSLKEVFACKDVPLKFLQDIQELRDFHKQDFDSVKSTVYPSTQLEEFDFYFDYVAGIIEKLKALGVI